MKKYLTLDVWDTIIRRHGHPDFSKLYSSYYIFLKYAFDLQEILSSPRDIYLKRCSIEADYAYSVDGGFGEYSLSDVAGDLYESIFKHYQGLDKENFVNEMSNIELSFEINNTYLDSGIFEEVLKHEFDELCFISDFYMGEDMLSEILCSNGAQEFWKGQVRGVSSCDVKKNKRTGDLFKYFKEKNAVDPNLWTHIGDNYTSDFVNPRNIGINSIHYLPNSEHVKREFKETLFDDRDKILEKLHADYLNEGGVSRQSASYFSSLIIGFLLFIAENSLRDRVEKIFFFTREGEFLINAWNALFPDGKYMGLALPKVSLLEVSRVATFCPSLREVTLSEFMRVWNLYSTQSFSAFASTLGMEQGIFIPLLRKYDIELEEEIVYPWEDLRVQRLFADVNFVELIENKVNSNRKLIERYFEQVGLTNGNYGVVDIGWRGTIQDNISYIQPDSKLHGYYLGLSKFLNDQPGNTEKSSFAINLNDSDSNRDLLDLVAPLEMLMNSPNGSVVGYNLESGKVLASRLIDDEENEIYNKYTQFVQKDIVSFISYISGHIDGNVLSHSDFLNISLASWRSLLESGGDVLSNYNQLNHNEVFGVGGFYKSSGVLPTIGDFFAAIFNKKKRIEVINFFKRNQSVELISQYKDMGKGEKLMFSMLLKLAIFYKNNFYRR